MTKKIAWKTDEVIITKETVLAPGGVCPCICMLKNSILGVMNKMQTTIGGREGGREEGRKQVAKRTELTMYTIDVEKRRKPTAPGIPRRSPIQVLTRPDVA